MVSAPMPLGIVPDNEQPPSDKYVRDVIDVTAFGNDDCNGTLCISKAPRPVSLLIVEGIGPEN